MPVETVISAPVNHKIHLPPHRNLLSYVSRPQVVAKCLVSDIWRARVLLSEDGERSCFRSDVIWVIDNYPCRQVEVVAWVCGVDVKEKSLLVHLDDGDGSYIITVNVVFTLSDPPLAVRPADTVRVKGFLNQWERRDGSIRQITVSSGSGGSIEFASPEDQYIHLKEVLRLHETIYSQPFAMPAFGVDNKDQANGEDGAVFASDNTICTTNGSVGSQCQSSLRLRHPDRLPSSSLTRPTFRRYLTKYLTESIITAVEDIEEDGGPTRIKHALEHYFPEYKALNEEQAKGGTRMCGKEVGTGAGGTPVVRKNRTAKATVGPLHPPSIEQILEVEILATLARRIVNYEIRTQERARKKRILAGEGTATDREIYEERRKIRKLTGYELTDFEREKAMQRLVVWALRDASEMGDIVNARLTSRLIQNSTWGYFTLPPPLLFPLIVPHFIASAHQRSRVSLASADPRYGSGLMIPELLERIRKWDAGERWVRMQEGRIMDAVEYGIGRGWLKVVGKGWETSEGYDGR